MICRNCGVGAAKLGPTESSFEFRAKHSVPSSSTVMYVCSTQNLLPRVYSARRLSKCTMTPQNVVQMSGSHGIKLVATSEYPTGRTAPTIQKQICMRFPHLLRHLRTTLVEVRADLVDVCTDWLVAMHDAGTYGKSCNDLPRIDQAPQQEASFRH